jgi:hypothetical protein
LINRYEILEFARSYGLDPNIVEKDYVIGWVLAGISEHPELADSWIFKGGTCLKKCFLETYRFSEDLDFTLLKPGHLQADFLTEAFSGVAKWIYEQTGIEIPEERSRFEIYQNPRGKPAGQGRLYYRGPMGRQGDPPRMKLDLAIELTAISPLPPVSRSMTPGDVPRIRPKRSTRRAPHKIARTASRYHGPRYIYRCPICQKKFTKKTNDSKLNRHKGQYGIECPGRTGYLVEIKSP